MSVVAHVLKTSEDLIIDYFVARVSPELKTTVSEVVNRRAKHAIFWKSFGGQLITQVCNEK